MSVAGETLTGIGLWITRRKRTQERDDTAVRSVLTALTRTKLYVAKRDRGDPIDREAEDELVELWTTASVHIRRTDPDLALRLTKKADYWTDPENWTTEEIVNNRIQIDDIAKEATRLLKAV